MTSNIKEEILDKLANVCVMNPQMSFADIIDNYVLAPNCVMTDEEVLNRIDYVIHEQTILRMKAQLGDRFIDVSGMEFTNKIFQVKSSDELTPHDIEIAFNQDAWIKISQGQMAWTWEMYMEFLKGIFGESFINPIRPDFGNIIP